MADLLIRHLKEKAEEHSALNMLVNQWGFDEKLIPKALQTIGSLFPHYSRHDESHSKQILINIERLLGENISRLTASDTWLLLEAAYWHDIGMVVPQKDIAEAFEDPKFQQYVTSIKNAPNHELNKFCLSFDSQDINKCFSGADTPMDAMDKLRQLMAEWFRIQHASRANEIIQEPWQSVGISSPRTELIPSRLFKLLGRVCHMHGLSFQQIIGIGGLPYREAGLAQEDCHPRFVACLLRMGDLLDLDDNRFCPVMQKIAGDNRPLMSKAHEEKHAGIRHLRIDRERIEISAECESVDAYLETYKWFDWLKQEIQDQMSHWQKIVPSREFGLLPTLGTIKVKLSGESQLLTEGQKPQFSIDDEQATELLQGSNLYSSKFACIRELLQNAVDATLLQLWLTKQSSEDEWKSPLNKIPLETFSKVPVTIILTEEINHHTPKEKTAWNLKIIDNGTGISRNDLSHMLNIGGSKRNTFRQEKILGMPEWMKPSGTFGIGFQSVFMICDEVKITTKDIFSNDAFEIIMYSPTGEKEGLVTIKTIETDLSKTYGTELDISFLLEKKSKNWNINSTKHQLSNKLVSSHDPLLDDNFPVEATRLFDEIIKFSENSMIPINGSFNTTDAVYPLKGYINKEKIDKTFLEVCGQSLLINYTPKLFARRKIEYTYRGQPFEDKIQFLSNITARIDLLSGKAGNWLTINRDKLSESGRERLALLTIEALRIKIKSDLESQTFIDKLELNEKRQLSFFIQEMSLRYDTWKDLAKVLDKQWYDLSFGKNKNDTYRVLSNKDTWIISDNIKPWDLNTIEEECDLLISEDYEAPNIRNLFINEWLKTSTNSVKIIESSNYENSQMKLRYKLSKKDQKKYTPQALATQLAIATQQSYFNTRYLLELNQKKWIPLCLKNDEIVPGIRNLFNIPTREAKFVLLPFLFIRKISQEDGLFMKTSPSDIDKFVEWVLPRLESPSTFEEIRSKYVELINFIDNDIMKPSPFWNEWKLERGL